MIYHAYIIQNGEGCDYTIGCGRRVISLEATERPAAITELEAIIHDEYSDGSERQLSNVLLLECVNAIKIDIDRIYRESRELQSFKKISAKEALEYEEYQRLRKKFGHE